MVESVRAWRPVVPVVHEVLHATFERHAYPAHTHDSWTVLLIDSGAVRYDLDRVGHVAEPGAVTLLPPHVPHDGRSAVAGRAFRKRVLYLDASWLPGSEDAAVRRPALRGARARAIVDGIHRDLGSPGDADAALQGVLALGTLAHARLRDAAGPAADRPLARRLRDLIDERMPESVTILEAAALLGAHPSHLVRAFSREYGIPPHRYLTGRRVDLARRLLLAGHRPAQVAADAGFYDQAHLTRHFRRVLGVTPAAFAA